MTTMDAKKRRLASNLPEEYSSQVDFFITKRRNQQQWEEVETSTVTINARTNNIPAKTGEHTQTLLQEII